MDTASHFVIGVGLAGLSQLDPVVSSQPAMQTAVILATIIGSQAPDFDTITRLRNNELYIRQHRGISHSIPAILLWTLIVSTSLYMLFQLNEGYGHILSWTFLAVGLHVFMDLFNTYGTQAIRPFSRRWISWNIIHIFDPFIFTTHVVAAVLWIVQLADPRLIFPSLYIIIALYYVIRTVYHNRLMKYLHMHIPIHDDEVLMIIPTVRYRIWHIMIKMADGSYKLGTWKDGSIRWVEQISSNHHPLIEKSCKHPSVAALQSFTTHTVAHVTQHHWGTEVRWSDARYRHRRQYPFVAIVFYNHDEQPLASYVGWLNDQKLYKRLYTQAKLSSV